ncbi:hypothetical protein SDJN03_01692, partial [Cucurbita argyrosperma subsp. sororia]
MRCGINRTEGSAAGKEDNRRMSNAERSAYFARREAAKILRRVLEGSTSSYRFNQRCFSCSEIKSVLTFVLGSDLHDHPLVAKMGASSCNGVVSQFLQAVSINTLVRFICRNQWDSSASPPRLVEITILA